MAIPEIAEYLDVLTSTVDALIATLDGLDETTGRWLPAVSEGNGLVGICQHVLGNVEQTLLGALYGQPVVRDREAELAGVGATIESTRARWQQLKPRVLDAVDGLTTEVLEQSYLHPRRGTHSGRGLFLLTTTHACIHLGEAELTRKLVPGS